MLSLPKPSFLSSYWQDSFGLKQHLQEFLGLEPENLENKLQTGIQELAKLGSEDFEMEKAASFYRDNVKDIYLFELGSWHLESQDYIGDTLRVVADRARGRVLDFGGGIGTHAIGAALCPNVTSVVYSDINPINCDFVEYRAKKLGLDEKLVVYRDELKLEEQFDTIICLDVIEHLPEPGQQLLRFHKTLTDEGNLIVNWYFHKGWENEYPFHVDDPKVVDDFFLTLQRNFLEVFHPYLITVRCYRTLIQPAQF